MDYVFWIQMLDHEILFIMYNNGCNLRNYKYTFSSAYEHLHI
jgi:hypothetical protein